MPYSAPTTAAYASTIVGGNLSPAFPSYSGVTLGVLETGVNSTSITAPTISGWTKVSPNVNAPCSALYVRLLQAGDTLSFQWDAGHAAYARISAFGGDVYTDLSTIVDSSSSDRGTNSTGRISVQVTAAPSQPNSLIIRGGHCVKSSTNNGSSFNDWLVDSGIYTKVGATQLVQTNANMAAALWYWQQTTATATSSDSAALTNTDSSANTQAFTVILKSAVTGVIPTRSLLGVGV
jgi:hypothetical protein